jgi:hypothetical protein
MRCEFDVVEIKMIRDIQYRLLSFGEEGEVRPLLISEENAQECDATKV